MRGDLLSGGLPKKLVCRDGRWSLEVVRQVAIERNVYRPHIQRLEGAEVILGYLRRSTQFQALAEKASGLLAQGETDVRSYEAVNGEWVQSALAPSYIEQLKLQHKAAAQKTHRVQLLEVRAECLRLRHANVRLEAKVDELERRLQELAGLVERLETREPLAVPAPAAQGSEALPGAPHQEQEEFAPTVSDAAQARRLLLPKASELVRCIEQLVGSQTTAHESQERLESAIGEKLYVSLLMDDDERFVGAIVMDIVATVYLGGTLLMLPEAELAKQVSMGQPSEDSVAASSEVCNALSGSVNNVADNVPVRTQYLEPLKIADLPWLKKPRVQMTLQDSFGGRIFIACP